MYFLDFGDFEIAGASPEPLVKVSGRRVETRPIAGTYPRGGDEEEDRANAEHLLADPKERAEHVMLVDLGRNDLGRVSEYGTRRGRRADGRRDLQPRPPHRQPRLGPAAGRPRRDGRASLGPAGGDALGRAEGPGDADHRRARAPQALLLRRRDRLPRLPRRPRRRDPHPHRRRQGRASPTSRPAAAPSPTPSPTTSTASRCRRRRRSSAPSRSPSSTRSGNERPRHRQLRLVHLQPRPVPGRARRRDRRRPQRQGRRRRAARPARPTGS